MLALSVARETRRHNLLTYPTYNNTDSERTAVLKYILTDICEDVHRDTPGYADWSHVRTRWDRDPFAKYCFSDHPDVFDCCPFIGLIKVLHVDC